MSALGANPGLQYHFYGASVGVPDGRRGAMVPRDVAMAMIDEAVAVNHTPGLDDRSDSG